MASTLRPLYVSLAIGIACVSLMFIGKRRGNLSSTSSRRVIRPSGVCSPARRLSRNVKTFSLDVKTFPAKKSTVSVAVVIVDHGSRREEANKMLFEFAELYKDISDRSIVEVAHMELARPSISDAVGKCHEKGAESVVVVPYFLSRGRHVQSDIPKLVEDARDEYPSLEITLADCLGMDKMIAQVIEARVSSAIEKQA
ncbi:hypothetical protein AAMO2058_001015400 [Amorphochlora amoebiformis]